MVSKSIINIQCEPVEKKLGKVWMPFHFYLVTQLDHFPVSLIVGVIKRAQKRCAPPSVNHSVNPPHTCACPLPPALYEMRVVNLQAGIEQGTSVRQKQRLLDPSGRRVAQLKNSHFECEIIKFFSSLNHNTLLDLLANSVTLTNT